MVNASATLSGSIGGLATLNSGTHLAPGDTLTGEGSGGTLTFAGGLTLNSDSILDFQLGTTRDLIAVTGGTLIAGTNPADYSFSLDATSHSLTYSGPVSAIPEPPTHAVLLSAVALGFALRRRIAGKPDSGRHPAGKHIPKNRHARRPATTPAGSKSAGANVVALLAAILVH